MGMMCLKRLVGCTISDSTTANSPPPNLKTAEMPTLSCSQTLSYFRFSLLSYRQVRSPIPRTMETLFFTMTNTGRSRLPAWLVSLLQRDKNIITSRTFVADRSRYPDRLNGRK
jgi:hypothetical protein